jgi:hypothetical protein
MKYLSVGVFMVVHTLVVLALAVAYFKIVTKVRSGGSNASKKTLLEFIVWLGVAAPATAYGLLGGAWVMAKFVPLASGPDNALTFLLAGIISSLVGALIAVRSNAGKRFFNRPGTTH